MNLFPHEIVINPPLSWTNKLAIRVSPENFTRLLDLKPYRETRTMLPSPYLTFNTIKMFVTTLIFRKDLSKLKR